MIFDFKANRIIAILGVFLLLIITLAMSNAETGGIMIVLVTLIYVFILARIMKSVASNGYRAIHQKLFVHADAKGYLEDVERLFKTTKRKKDFEGIKLQNLIMAYVFAGDFDKAREYQQLFLKEFEDQLNRHDSVRFSKGMIETLIVLFDYNEDLFLEAYNRLNEQLNTMQPETIQHVRENPYSIFYMITRLKEMIIDENDVTVDKVKELVNEANEFLKASVLYMVFRNNYLDATYVNEFEKTPGNTMFYRDQESIY